MATLEEARLSNAPSKRKNLGSRSSKGKGEAEAKAKQPLKRYQRKYGDVGSASKGSRYFTDKQLRQIITEYGSDNKSELMRAVVDESKGKCVTADVVRILWMVDPEWRPAGRLKTFFSYRRNVRIMNGLPVPMPLRPGEEELIPKGKRAAVTGEKYHNEKTSSRKSRPSLAYESDARTYDQFGDAPNDDPYELQLFAARVRRGQPVFRKNLMAAYDRRCVISGHGPEDALNAVHIEPHAQSGINELDNGLLMRADLHSLFDVGLLRINPKSLRVVIDSSLRNTPYEEFDGRKIGARRDGKQPSARYLKKRWDGKVFDL